MQRREFGKLTAGAAAALLLSRLARSEETPATDAATATLAHEEAMARHAAFGAGPKLTIGMLVYPGMFLQDLVGPLAMFESLMNREIHLLWKTRDVVANERPEHPALIPVTPTTSFAECPERLDVLFVPGGVPGTLTMMEDAEVLAFLAAKGATAGWVTSVCTGSLILGAAGLLNGYRATSHWVTRDVLAELGAIPTPGRIVVDRNRMTGGGVTAGLDFGLELVARLRSPLYAQAVQLYLEYDPRPPFDAGAPERAPAEAKAFLDEMFVGLRDAASATAHRARARLG